MIAKAGRYDGSVFRFMQGGFDDGKLVVSRRRKRRQETTGSQDRAHSIRL
jgi:hypothetical protein